MNVQASQGSSRHQLLPILSAALLFLVGLAASARGAEVAVTPEATDSATITSTAVSGADGSAAQGGDEAMPNSCAECHPSIVKGFVASAHGLPAHGANPASLQSCATCHGDMSAHLAAGGGADSVQHRFTKAAKVTAAEKNATCLQCHANGAREHWVGGKHEQHGLACVDCHSVHGGNKRFMAKKTIADTCMACHVEKRGDFNKMSHHPVIEGKMTCTDCHSPHGDSDKLISTATINDKCYQCHAEKRGPFLHEHPPVAENCMNCHTPHGSIHNKLLKNKPPFLCQTCHTNGGHQAGLFDNVGNPAVGAYNPAASQAAPGSAAFNSQTSFQSQYRGCINCHAMIHGSNHPAGVYFQR